MKRYQCIKNVWAEPELIYPEAGRQLLFKQGDFYYEQSLDNYPELTDDKGNVHLITPELLENFKDVTTLDRPQPKKRIGTGCAILIVTILTVLALIFFR